MPTRSTLLGLLLAAAAVVIAAVAVVGDDDGGPVSGETPEGRKPMIFDPGPLGFEPSIRESTFDEIAALGADTVRLAFIWQGVSPDTRPAGFDSTDPSSEGYDFVEPDNLVRQLKERGLRILITLIGPFPKWASSSGRSNFADPNPEKFGQFAQAVATRYSGRFDPGEGDPLPAADLWSIWNEPNLSIFLKPQFRGGEPYSPLLYRRLFVAAADAIHGQIPKARVLAGETAPTGSTDSVDPVAFARGVLCLDEPVSSSEDCGEPLDAAGWAMHPYATGTTVAPFDLPNNPGFVTIGVLSRLESVLDEAAVAGEVRPRLPIEITEFGVQSEPDPLLGVSLSEQAEYLSIAERIAYANPRVVSFGQYLLVDDPPDRVPGVQYGGFESGLRSSDGREKPSYPGFRTPLVVQHQGGQVAIWGLVRPARGETEVEIRARDGGGSPQSLLSLDTDSAGIFTARSTYAPDRRWQVVWENPEGETLNGPWIRSYAFRLPPDAAP